MKNLRYLITVLALVNAGLVAQAAAAGKPSHHHGISAVTTAKTNLLAAHDFGTE